MRLETPFGIYEDEKYLEFTYYNYGKPSDRLAMFQFVLRKQHDKLEKELFYCLNTPYEGYYFFTYFFLYIGNNIFTLKKINVLHERVGFFPTIGFTCKQRQLYSHRLRQC
jgi:hypothetical protein